MNRDLVTSQQYYASGHPLAVQIQITERGMRVLVAFERFQRAVQGKYDRIAPLKIMEVTQLGRELDQLKELKLWSLVATWQQRMILRLNALSDYLEQTT